MNTRNLCFLLFNALILVGCLPYEEEVLEVNVDLTSSDFRKVFEFQDRQEPDSLIPYFYNDDPSVRYTAIAAFSSIQDPNYIDTLASLLNNNSDLLKSIAAYSIGQTCGSKAEDVLINSFNNYDTSGYYKKSNRAILEAIGKCGSDKLLTFLSNITTYRPSDTLLLEGQAFAIFRYMLRDISSFESTQRMVGFLTNTDFPNSVKLIAANYLSRVKNVPLDTFAQSLSRAASNINDPNIKLPLVLALGKTKRQVALDTLIQIYKRSNNNQVKSNILVAFQQFDYSQVQPIALEGLKDPNPYVAQRAAEFFIENGVPQDATFYWRTAKDTLPWQVQLLLYQAANRHLPAYFAETRGLINYELRRKLNQATSPYERAAVIKSLAEFPWNYRFIYQKGFSDSTFFVKTSTVEALANIGGDPDFSKIFRGGSRQVTRELAQFFREAITSKDLGMTTIAADALVNPERNYNEFLDSLTFLRLALKEIPLPKGIEAYNAVKKALNFFEGNGEFKPHPLEYNHPIDWSVLDDYEKDPNIAIKTTKGTIIARLYPKSAPATVISFLDLVNTKYYHGKIFHRVVPNFVIQGGGARGDGYGAEDFSLRSEFAPLNYNEPGFIGMASAGPHTEGTQFFITQAPTPHLDGRYTIFGKVNEESMAIVNKIQVGDKIESVIIR